MALDRDMASIAGQWLPELIVDAEGRVDVAPTRNGGSFGPNRMDLKTDGRFAIYDGVNTTQGRYRVAADELIFIDGLATMVFGPVDDSPQAQLTRALDAIKSRRATIEATSTADHLVLRGRGWQVSFRRRDG